jgi:hypothetical protein
MSNQENITLVIREINDSQIIINPTRKVFEKREIRKPISMSSIIYGK